MLTNGHMDGWTDGRTEKWTDIPYYRDARTHQENQNKSKRMAKVSPGGVEKRTHPESQT